MAIKGLSKPIVADYTANGNKVTYGEPYIADHAVEYSVKINSGDKKELYADNQVQESSKGIFTSGDLTLKTSDFEPKLSAKIVGAKTVERTVGENTVKEVVLDDSQNSTYKGFGIIEEHEIDSVTSYLPVVFPRVVFLQMQPLQEVRVLTGRQRKLPEQLQDPRKSMINTIIRGKFRQKKEWQQRMMQ